MLLMGYTALIMAANLTLELSWMIFLQLYLIVVMITILTDLYSVNAILFSAKDNELLFSYPVEDSVILLGKITAIYLQNLLTNLVFTVPFVVAYAYTFIPPPIFYLYALLGYLLIPIVPLVLTVILSYVINTLTMGTRYKTLVNIVLTVAILGGIIYLMGFAFGMGEDVSANGMIGALKRSYPPVGFILGAMFLPGRGIDILYFILMSIIPGGLMVWILSKFYRRLWSKNMSVKPAGRATSLTGASSSTFIALVKKEIRRFFSSAMYVMNTGIGVILIFIMAIVLFFSADSLTEILGELGGLDPFPMVSAALLFMLSMSSVTAPSISLEGKNLWIVKSMPVGAKYFLLAKLSLHAIIMVPLMIVSIILTAIAMDFTLIQFLLLLGLSLTCTSIAGIMGLIANLHWHRFDYYNDMQAVKNSSSVLITILLMFVYVGVIIGLYFAFASLISAEVFALIVFLVSFAIAGTGYYYLMTKGIKLAENL
jgi:ABC-2 type transport system permease protein